MTAVALNGPNQRTFCGKLRPFVDQYFHIKNRPAWETTLKVISYATLIIPAIMFLVQRFLRCYAPLPRVQAAPVRQVPIPQNIEVVLNRTPLFKGYFIGQGTPYQGTGLASATVRPANLFYRAVLGDGATTMPGSNELFRFLKPHDQIRKQIQNEDPEQIIAVSAEMVAGNIGNHPVADLSEIYGHGHYRLSYNELQDVLDSQTIYTASPLPLRFYRMLKLAMEQDKIVTLPGNDAQPIKLGDLQTAHCRELIDEAGRHLAHYGFQSLGDYQALLNLTLYQLGSLVVKTEKYHLLVDDNMKIRDRNPGDRDVLRLINCCGIRGIRPTDESPLNRKIMTQAFKAALASAENGFVIFPAIGMGVWGGNPNLYWPALLDAIVQTEGALEQIFINPRHPATQVRGVVEDGGELQQMIHAYRIHYANNPVALARLNKMVNLYERQTDVLHLANHLKQAFPDKIVSLVNASDPDVTLGNHVGEYVNRLNPSNTTEENWTSLGTNGICFEGITGIQDNRLRFVQVKA